MGNGNLRSPFVTEQGTSYAADSTTHRRFMMRRTAAQHAAFFLPHLRAGMRLLDCGCGSGSITVGLAEVVAPGEAVGIDVDEGEIAVARAHAAEQGVTNVRYQTGNAYTLPFPDNFFDAVFSHGVLEHLADPVSALKEMYRVLKPGAVAGVRCTDHEGDLLAPSTPILAQIVERYKRMVDHMGGNPGRGAELRALFREAGLVRTRASASYDSYATPDATRVWAAMVANTLREEKTVERWVSCGVAEREWLERAASAYEEWGYHADAFAARAWGEAVGWKE